MTPSFKLNPHIDFVEAGSETLLVLPMHGLQVSCPNEIAQVLRQSSVDLDAFTDEALRFLEHNFILLSAGHYDFLKNGFFRRQNGCARQSLVSAVSSISPLTPVLFNAPLEFDRPSATGSVKFGGRRVREILQTIVGASEDHVITDFDSDRELFVRDLKLLDLGEIVFHSEIEEITNVGRRVTVASERICRAGGIPIAIGGDHSVAYFNIAGLRVRNGSFLIVHFDAHHDFYTSDRPNSVTKNILNHANFQHKVAEFEEVERIVQVGLRDLWAHQLVEPAPYAHKVRKIGARQAMKASAEEIFADIEPGSPIYISFDLDVMELPDRFDTATPVVGGLSFWTAFDLFKHLTENFRVIGCDFCEIGGASSSAGSSADIAARLLMELLISFSETRQISHYVSKNR